MPAEVQGVGRARGEVVGNVPWLEIIACKSSQNAQGSVDPPPDMSVAGRPGIFGLPASNLVSTGVLKKCLSILRARKLLISTRRS